MNDIEKRIEELTNELITTTSIMLMMLPKFLILRLIKCL